MVMTNFQKVKTFMESFGQEVKDKPDVPPEDIVQLRLNLINEEFIELVNATEESTEEATDGAEATTSTPDGDKKEGDKKEGEEKKAPTEKK